MGWGILIDLLVLFGLVGGILQGLRRGLAQQFLSVVMLFLATAFSGLLYSTVISLFASFSSNAVSNRTGGVIVFFGLLVAFYAILEYTLHRNYPGLRIKALGHVGNILGAVVGFFWAMLGISLLLLILDYSASIVGGPAAFINELLRTSYLTPLFRHFFNIPLAGLRPLFPNGLPEVLAYFAIK
ncbi:MAG TPA: CvpA family protein [Anaerolineae bacterium]|nr:CvpA family protein [Anaerolineae bacterium]